MILSLSSSPVVMILDIENTVRKVRAYNLHTLQTRKICFSPKNGAVSGLMWYLIRANTVRLPRADVDPRAEMNPSLAGMGQFWRKLCSNGSRRGWIRLWPAGLNWHFGAETDLFNFQCTTWKWVGSVISENQQASFVTEWNLWYGSNLRNNKTRIRRTKSGKKPFQSTFTWETYLIG